MLKPEHSHHCIFINPDQVERLLYLVDAANSLFKRLQVISIVDLLYAVLWRQISATGFVGIATTLTVIEVAAKSVALGDRCVAGILQHTFTSTGDYLESQPVVSVAQRIRRSLQEQEGDTAYEGWLVDSLGSNALSSMNPADFGGLICSSSTLPFLMNIVHERSLKRLSDIQRACGDAGASLSVDPCAGLSLGVPEADIDLPTRIFCINMACSSNGIAKRGIGIKGNDTRDISAGDCSADGDGMDESVLGGSVACNSTGMDNVNEADASFSGYSGGHDRERNSVISIDMWLPCAEMSRFKLLHGKRCFVDDSFFDN